MKRAQYFLYSLAVVLPLIVIRTLEVFFYTDEYGIVTHGLSWLKVVLFSLILATAAFTYKKAQSEFSGVMFRQEAVYTQWDTKSPAIIALMFIFTGLLTLVYMGFMVWHIKVEFFDAEQLQHAAAYGVAFIYRDLVDNITKAVIVIFGILAAVWMFQIALAFFAKGEEKTKQRLHKSAALSVTLPIWILLRAFNTFSGHSVNQHDQTYLYPMLAVTLLGVCFTSFSKFFGLQLEESCLPGTIMLSIVSFCSTIGLAAPTVVTYITSHDYYSILRIAVDIMLALSAFFTTSIFLPRQKSLDGNVPHKHIRKDQYKVKVIYKKDGYVVKG